MRSLAHLRPLGFRHGSLRSLRPRVLLGGARGSRTPDLVNAIHALSQLSYGPNFANPFAALGKRRKWSALFFFLDRLADDIGYVGVAFFLFLDKGGIVHAL